MTAEERKAFREGCEEGYVRAVEWFYKHVVETGDLGPYITDTALDAFRPVKPNFDRRKTTVTGQKARAIRKMNAGGSR